jgi:hypothetical protein
MMMIQCCVSHQQLTSHAACDCDGGKDEAPI